MANAEQFDRGFNYRLIDNGDGTYSKLETAMKGQQSTFNAVIAAAGTKSAAVDLGVFRAVGLVMPAAFTGATLTFESSIDNSTFNPVYKDGSAVSEAVGTSRRIVLDPAKFYGIRYLKIVSGSTEGSDRTVTVVAEA